jgi:hypothetical protein
MPHTLNTPWAGPRQRSARPERDGYTRLASLGPASVVAVAHWHDSLATELYSSTGCANGTRAPEELLTQWEGRRKLRDKDGLALYITVCTT